MPLAARARPSGTYSLIVGGPGDKTEPSIDGQSIVYASNASGDWDVLRYQIGAPDPIQTIAGGPGDQDQPDVNRTNFVYRGPEGIWIRSWTPDTAPLRTPHPPEDGEIPACSFESPVSNPALGEDVATWECGLAGSGDIPGSRAIAVFLLGSGEEYRLEPSGASTIGEQHSPAAYGSTVAFVDDADGGSVWLHDSNPLTRETTRVCEGHATGVAIGYLDDTVLAVARASQGHDDDIEIWEPGVLGTALRVGGVQRNPHLSADWVAFEDLSTGHSQVVLWHWTSGAVFIPHPSTTNETLNDVVATRGVDVRVVFAEDGGADGTRDIALYRLVLTDGEIPDDGSGDGGWRWPPSPPPPQRPSPASCDDTDPVVLATLVLGRDAGRPLAGSVPLAASPFPGDAVLPVLVCIDADRVSAAWVAFDDQAVAMPGDFDPHVSRLQIAAVAEGGVARISGVVAGRPGTSLVARVLADPGRSQGGETLRQVPAAALLRGGCGMGGGAGSLAVLAVLAALRRQRRR